jgi:hypothetical protein
MDQNALVIPFPIFLPYVTSPLSPVQLADKPDHENTNSGLLKVLCLVLVISDNA